MKVHINRKLRKWYTPYSLGSHISLRSPHPSAAILCVRLFQNNTTMPLKRVKNMYWTTPLPLLESFEISRSLYQISSFFNIQLCPPGRWSLLRWNWGWMGYECSAQHCAMATDTLSVLLLPPSIESIRLNILDYEAYEMGRSLLSDLIDRPTQCRNHLHLTHYITRAVQQNLALDLLKHIQNQQWLRLLCLLDWRWVHRC